MAVSHRDGMRYPFMQRAKADLFYRFEFARATPQHLVAQRQQ